MTSGSGPSNLLGMEYVTRPNQLVRQINHFTELIEGTEEYLSTRGFPEGFTKSQMRETTPQYMEMELMLRMWIRELVQLGGKAGIRDQDLTEILNARTKGMYEREFSGLPSIMRDEGELIRTGRSSEIYWTYRKFEPYTPWS